MPREPKSPIVAGWDGTPTSAEAGAAASALAAAFDRTGFSKAAIPARTRIGRVNALLIFQLGGSYESNWFAGGEATAHVEGGLRAHPLPRAGGSAHVADAGGPGLSVLFGFHTRGLDCDFGLRLAGCRIQTQPLQFSLATEMPKTSVTISLFWNE
jgi:hypothetical protein